MPIAKARATQVEAFFFHLGKLIKQRRLLPLLIVDRANVIIQSANLVFTV
jgi:hypothetical protein